MTNRFIKGSVFFKVCQSKLQSEMKVGTILNVAIFAIIFRVATSGGEQSSEEIEDSVNLLGD